MKQRQETGLPPIKEEPHHRVVVPEPRPAFKATPHLNKGRPSLNLEENEEEQQQQKEEVKQEVSTQGFEEVPDAYYAAPLIEGFDDIMSLMY
jgi:hypothetical protein